MKNAPFKTGINILILALGLAFTASAFAQSVKINSRKIFRLELKEITDNSLARDFFQDTRDLAINGLPDGRVATGTSNIREAFYTEPTKRYQHGVLGDAIEGGALKIVDDRGARHTYRLPRSEVFEDITPRIVDIDNDGNYEVVTIISSRSQGASIAVFRLNGSAILKVAQTDFIGRSNRWLNIAEISNIFGNTSRQITAIIRPHLDGILRFYDLANDQFRLVASFEGFSNHKIGSRELRLSTIVDLDRNGIPDLVVPSLDRKELVFFGRVQNRIQELARQTLPSAIKKSIETRVVNRKTEIVVGLEDGKSYSISLQ